MSYFISKTMQGEHCSPAIGIWWHYTFSDAIYVWHKLATWGITGQAFTFFLEWLWNSIRGMRCICVCIPTLCFPYALLLCRKQGPERTCLLVHRCHIWASVKIAGWQTASPFEKRQKTKVKCKIVEVWFLETIYNYCLLKKY